MTLFYQWCKNLDWYLRETSRIKTLCPIYIKPLTTTISFNKYTVRSYKKNMYHCLE